jgi:steroid 5-alpha reductase family enzyme
VTAFEVDLAICVGLMVSTWTLSLVTRDVSWVDRVWSIAPAVYVAVFALDARLDDARLDLMAALTIAWGARLTFNLARKGGYRSGSEDYRWAVLRAEMSPRRFALFNLFFVSIYQNALLLLIALPADVAFVNRSRALVGPDVVLAALFFACLAAETVADQQQWDFQCAKRDATASGTPGLAFLRTGLFRYSRHPNYFFELAQWWLLVGFAVTASRSWAPWSAAGAVLLTLLFVGSTRFTERVSRAKYPDYADYQRATSPVIPWRPRRDAAPVAEAPAS